MTSFGFGFLKIAPCIEHEFERFDFISGATGTALPGRSLAAAIDQVLPCRIKKISKITLN
jgi:hypothetical protein